MKIIKPLRIYIKEKKRQRCYLSITKLTRVVRRMGRQKKGEKTTQMTRYLYEAETREQRRMRKSAYQITQNASILQV